jgi:transcriptional regulator GlxA family with amidase domain
LGERLDRTQEVVGSIPIGSTIPASSPQFGRLWHYLSGPVCQSTMMHESPAESTRRIAMLGFDGIQILDVTGPLEVFSLASRLLFDAGHAAVPPYEVLLIAEQAGPVRTSSGLGLVAACSWRDLGPVDTLLVSGGIGTRKALDDEPLIAWLARQAPACRRYGSVCTGALLLGRAGLLEGRRVATHWAYVQDLADIAPTAYIEPDAIFVRDDRLWTSAGVTAGMDMALAMVEEDFGRKLALDVARRLVMYLKRPGGQSQFSALLAAQAMSRDGRFQRLVGWIVEHPGQDLSIAALAERTSMSLRHFSRCFREETGLTPARFVEQVRFEAAQRLLTEEYHRLEKVAELCGFGSAETLRRVFVRRAGMGPAAFRRHLRRGAIGAAPVTQWSGL